MKRIVWGLICFLIINLMTPVQALYNNSEAMACVLNKVEQAVNTYSSSVDVSSCRISNSELNEFFFDASAGTLYRDLISSFTYKYRGNYVYSLSLSYRYDRTSTNKLLTEFNEEVNTLLSGLETSMNDLDKLFYLHNYLALNTAYDSEAATNVTNSNSKTVEAKYALSFSTLGPLVMGKAVCSGYSQGYMYLLNKLGIEAKYLTSSSMNHGWNIVKYNGNWYHVDVTYDDPVPDALGYVDYKYFMMNSTEISEDHEWDDNTISANSNALSGEQYIFNQNIKDAYYEKGYWYYVKDQAIYRSQIDGSDLSLFYGKESILDIVVSNGIIYYTTTSNGYFVKALKEMDLKKSYNMELQTFTNGTYQAGLYLADGELYLTKRNGGNDHYQVSGNEVVFKSYLEHLYFGDHVLKGDLTAYEVYKNLERDCSGTLKLMLDGRKSDYFYPLKDSGYNYTFEVPYADLRNDDYLLKIVVDDTIYDFLKIEAESFYTEDGKIGIEFKDNVLSIDNGEPEKEINLEPYSYMNMEVYKNSRVASITQTANGFKVTGYMFEAHTNCDKKNSIWREIVFVSVDNQDPKYAYRKLVEPVESKFLNNNSLATDDYKYRLDYAGYEVEVDPQSMLSYLDKKETTMAAGEYYVYMRISNGKTSYLFPLKDNTLANGANMENTGMLPDGFEIIDQESRQLKYTVK